MFLLNVAPFKREINRLSDGAISIAKKERNDRPNTKFFTFCGRFRCTASWDIIVNKKKSLQSKCTNNCIYTCTSCCKEKLEDRSCGLENYQEPSHFKKSKNNRPSSLICVGRNIILHRHPVSVDPKVFGERAS